MKKSLNITFINTNTEEQIVQAFAGYLAYNLAEKDEKIKFDYTNSNTYQNSHNIEDELELKLNLLKIKGKVYVFKYMFIKYNLV